MLESIDATASTSPVYSFPVRTEAVDSDADDPFEKLVAFLQQQAPGLDTATVRNAADEIIDMYLQNGNSTVEMLNNLFSSKSAESATMEDMLRAKNQANITAVGAIGVTIWTISRMLDAPGWASFIIMMITMVTATLVKKSTMSPSK
jgi:hypothetical protein